MTHPSPAAQMRLAQALASLADVLLPGNDTWPSGAAVGVQHAVLRRYIEAKGEDTLAQLAETLGAHGLPLLDQSDAARADAVSAFESNDPDLFGWLQDASYFAYYEDASVVALIAARGTPYSLRPHIKGYDLPKFDLETQTPTHGRGHYIATKDVRPVDISGLELDTRITTKWGLQR